ncbi:MAG: hypothetical protein GXP48_07630 [Acidobacteria bacterium]|nr:hypothetical protein [Acidobacteriota bacterium]
MSTPNYSLLLIMICFWVAYWVINHFLIEPVTEVMNERARRLDGAEAEWSRRHQEYLDATARLEEESGEAARDAAKYRAELRQQALGAKHARLDEARATASKRLEQALADLDRASDDARAELRKKAVELSRILASRLLEREVAS